MRESNKKGNCGNSQNLASPQAHRSHYPILKSASNELFPLHCTALGPKIKSAWAIEGPTDHTFGSTLLN